MEVPVLLGSPASVFVVTNRTVPPAIATLLASTPAPPPAKPTVAAKPAATPLPTVERSQPSSSASFLTPIELELELAEPIMTSAELQRLVDGVQELNGVAHVSSDGLHLSVRYDSALVLPARIRDRLAELGHPARAGTEIQNPGDTAD